MTDVAEITAQNQIDGLRPGLQKLACDAEAMGMAREDLAATLIGFGHALIEARDGRLAADSFLAGLARRAVFGEDRAN